MGRVCSNAPDLDTVLWNTALFECPLFFCVQTHKLQMKILFHL